VRLEVVVFDCHDAGRCLAVLQGSEEVELAVQIFDSVGGFVGDESVPCTEEGGSSGRQLVLNCVFALSSEVSEAVEGDLACAGLNFEGMPSLISSWKIRLSLFEARVDNRSHQQTVADQEFSFNNFILVDFLVEGELEVERSEEGAFALRRHHDCVHVLQQRIPGFETLAAGVEQRGTKAVGLLASASVDVVVSRKGVEGAQLVPARAKFLGGVPVESADIGAHHLDAEDLEQEIAVDGQSQEFPVGHVVAGPMSGKAA
jgi:hypothetical protein